MKSKIIQLKKEKNAIILAHYYTYPEVQEVADFVGDSLALARKAAETQADIILFAGVHFMAETAKILNPTKKVLIPDMLATCSLADSCKADDLREFLKNYPDYMVLSYVNCSAEVKALSDIIVTSGNALKIVNSLPQDAKIVFAPDHNLGSYINGETGRNMVLWNGACHVHNLISPDRVIAIKEEYPDAKVLAHPECNAAVLKLADFVGSTAAMLNFSISDSANSYIVVTEVGILHEMRKNCPNKTFYSVNDLYHCNCATCEYMKLNDLENILACLENESPELLLDEKLMDAARKPIERMLSLS